MKGEQKRALWTGALSGAVVFGGSAYLDWEIDGITWIIFIVVWAGGFAEAQKQAAVAKIANDDD